MKTKKGDVKTTVRESLDDNRQKRDAYLDGVEDVKSPSRWEDDENKWRVSGFLLRKSLNTLLVRRYEVF